MAVDEAELFFRSGERLVFQVKLLSIHHAPAPGSCAERLCCADADRCRSGRTGHSLEGLRQQHIARQHGSRLSECLVAGGLAPAHIVIVHAGQVVVDE